jgi:hypothetical protein
MHLKLDSDSLKSYHAIGRNRYRADFNALIFNRMSKTGELAETLRTNLGGLTYGKDHRN